MKKSEADRLGTHLLSRLTADDMTLLDSYRRAFRPAFEAVVDRIRSELALEVSGRPAKSTTAIVDKLKRGSMRLTQMQDIAGCRILVPDIGAQDKLVVVLSGMFDATVIDRRVKPSHGYRAVHVVVKSADFPVEIQIRTDSQHVWAQLSEKLADIHGISTKYGGGPDFIRKPLSALSRLIEDLELHPNADDHPFGSDIQLNVEIRRLANLMIALRPQP